MRANALKLTVGTRLRGSADAVMAFAPREAIDRAKPGLRILPVNGQARVEAIEDAPACEATRGPRSVADWAEEITSLAAQRTSNTLGLALLVCRAREALRKRGQWSQLWSSAGRRLGFRRRKAYTLIAIGKGLGQANVHDRAQFPSALRTLHCLAQIGWPAVQQLLDEGRIYPSLTLLEAKALLAEFRPNALTKAPASALKRRLANFGRFVRRHYAAWSPEERTLVCGGLRSLADEISSAQAPIPNPEI